MEDGRWVMPNCKVSTEPFLDESDQFRSLASQLGIVFAHFGEIRLWILRSSQPLLIRYPLRYLSMDSWSNSMQLRVPPREALIKSHRGRCGKNGPRARRLGTSIPAAGCKYQANTAPGLLSSQPYGLKPVVDFCGVARSGETAAGIAQRSRLQKSATVLQRPSWDLFSASLRREKGCLRRSVFPQPRVASPRDWFRWFS